MVQLAMILPLFKVLHDERVCVLEIQASVVAHGWQELVIVVHRHGDFTELHETFSEACFEI